MADVSVRFQLAGDSEIVLNLATPQAIRLVQALMGKVADAMGAPDRLSVGSAWPAQPAGAPPGMFTADRHPQTGSIPINGMPGMPPGAQSGPGGHGIPMPGTGMHGGALPGTGMHGNSAHGNGMPGTRMPGQ